MQSKAQCVVKKSLVKVLPKARKAWLYNKDHGTTTMGYHVTLEHSTILKLYQIWHFNVIIKFDVHQTIKKGRKLIIASIANFFNSGIPYEKINLIKKKFFKDSILRITKGYCPLNSIENISLKRFIFHLCIWVVFINRKQFTSEVIPTMFNRTMEWYVILVLDETSQLLPLWIYGCLEEAWTLVHLL